MEDERTAPEIQNMFEKFLHASIISNDNKKCFYIGSGHNYPEKYTELGE